MATAIAIAINFHKAGKKMRPILSAIALSTAMLLPSCCFLPCGPWKLCCSKGALTHMNSFRLYLPAKCDSKNLEIEFVATSDGLRLYLSVYGLEIPASEEDCHRSLVSIDFGESCYDFFADRFVGGQRLLLPVYVQNDIVAALQIGQTVSLTTGRYSADIPADQFLDLFDKMMKQSYSWWRASPCDTEMCCDEDGVDVEPYSDDSEYKEGSYSVNDSSNEEDQNAEAFQVSNYAPILEADQSTESDFSSGHTVESSSWHASETSPQHSIESSSNHAVNASTTLPSENDASGSYSESNSSGF
jgi:hypothetical protein